ncbi:hypothetical protein [Neobacillus ginsengisoli]|uniref:DUF3221 domain-containing protein n=1 Tax=Neobacillus ginsengisoli TaxID=904295 RepID=A0ABT9XUH9_9BACI|nr:hypothetical protein [Neobacillus ginsengisoli]MDQ0199221.1 hypothetical protein [Neobacillus ginsengisoli]
MFKRIIILLVLSSILLALVLVRAHTADPVNNTSTKSNGSSGYTTLEYKISSINGNQYYGKSEDGTGIHFSSKNILSGDKIQVNDVVICYFEKNNLGKGLVKVEKK